ncbi:hypothetical protein CLOP_g15283 [Closterium sp. NIES-67]|nr:hypothetical protein CLOP_g15283 [Closterium sp. NIES-67]
MAPSYPFKRPEPARRSLTAAELNGSKVASGPTLKPSNSTEPIQKPSSRPEPARRSLTAAELAGFSGLPVHSFLRLRFLSASPDRVVATLVSSRQSAQPFGNLHGGVSALITEAVGSLGAAVAAGGAVVGVEVACSHLRPAPIGTPVVAVGTPLRVGRTVQVWEVRLSVGRESDLVQGEETSLNVKVQNGTGETSSASELRGTESPEGRSAGPGPGQLPALESPDRKRGGSRPGHPLALEHRETKRGGPRAGQLLAVGRLTCVPLPQGHAMGENGGRSGEGEEEGHRNGRREGGLEKAGEEGGEGREEEQGSREEGREGSLARMLHSELELEPAQVNTAVFDTPRFNSLPIHKFLGLRFLVASPRRVVATFISSPASAQPFNNVHGGVSALITESLGSVGASLAAGGQWQAWK